MNEMSEIMAQESLPVSLAVITVTFLLALALTGWVKRGLLARQMLDIPNARSSHQTPVPRGGGWALLLIFVPALLLAAHDIDGGLQHVGLIASVGLLAGISWCDDRRHINPLLRLSLHILAAYLGTLSFDHDQLMLGGWVPFWLDRTLMVFGWAWFINLYNFMDGIDGITGVETITLATGTCLVMSAAGVVDPFVTFLTLVLTGACLGFLGHNWHPARIFLGDVGSVPLGYLTGFCLLSLAVKGFLAAALILPLYYLADSGITITRRALRGERIWQAHREHFYQKAANGVGHDHTVTVIILANAALIFTATSATTRPVQGLGISLLIVAVLLGKLHKMATPSPRNS